MRTKMLNTLLLLAISMVLFAPAADAAEPGSNLAGYAGWLFPDGDRVDQDLVYGVSYGYNVNEYWGNYAKTGFFNVNSAVSNEDIQDAIDDLPLSLDLWMTDLNAIWYPRGGNFGLFAGLGYQSARADLYVPGEDNNRSVSDGYITYNLGANWQWNVGEAFFIRPETTIRWVDQADVVLDASVWEAVMHFGWKF